MGPQRVRLHRQVPAVPAHRQRGRRHRRIHRCLRYTGQPSQGLIISLLHRL